MRNNWNGGYNFLLDKNTCNGFLMFQKQYTGNNIYQTTLTLRHKDWPKYESKYEEIIINDSQDKSKQIYVHSGVSDNVCLMSIFNQNEQSISIYQGNTDCYANVGARANFKKKLFVGDNGYNEELKYINDSILEANFQMESAMKYAQTITN
ncbi:hypothetical protein [Vibrio mediterranei]|uniref:hypothetical protein n=1 Tax=Vibrio mediterranei TaxID=689 RepID=UPI00148C43D9|nr:hypothetical protein [Vibrio mediterranei]NOI26470.1 hypothetical protein [Vibrio mediterranei]